MSATAPVRRKLRALGIKSISDLRNAATDASLAAVKTRAYLAAATSDPAVVTMLSALDFKSLSQFAAAPLATLKAGVKKAVKAGTLARQQTPSDADLLVTQDRARQLYGYVVQAKVTALVTSANDDCEACDEDCCGEASSLSLLSKPSYINYLVRKTGLDSSELSATLQQDFAATGCDVVPLVRIAIEVLERALFRSAVGSDFPAASMKAFARMMLWDRVLVRQTLLSRTAALPAAERRQIEATHGEISPLPSANPTNPQLAALLNEVEQGNRELTRYLEEHSMLGSELIRSASLQTTTSLILAAQARLRGNWDAEAALSLSSPAAFAVAYRDKLIALTGASASELRQRYHVNFMASAGSISRCDQAILTLQEALRCGSAWYISCCASRTSGETTHCVEEAGTKFKDYPEYRLWIEKLLFPDIFYDFHVKSPLIAGDTARLTQELTQAQDVLERVTQKPSPSDSTDEDSLLKSMLGLFRQGIQTVRELSEIDDLIAQGHAAHRNEEYRLALALYQQAQGRIRRHVQTYHSRTLPTYDQMFYGNYDACGGGETAVRDAAELCEVLKVASIRPGLRRELIPNDKLQAVAVDGWLPRMEELPTEAEWKNFVAYLAPGAEPEISLWSRLFVNDDHLVQLRAAQKDAGWTLFDYPGNLRLRYSLPMIAHDDEQRYHRGITDVEVHTREYLLQIFKTEIETLLNGLGSDPPDFDALKTAINDALNVTSIALSAFKAKASNVKTAIESRTDLRPSLDDVKDWIESAFSSCSGASADRAAESHWVEDPPAWEGGPPRGHYEFGTPFSLGEFIDCMAGEIVDQVRSSLPPAPRIPSFTDLQNGWAGVDAGIQRDVDAELDRLARAADLADAAAGANLEASRDYLIKIIKDIGNEILKDDQSIWGVRDGKIQELSNLTQLDEIRDQNPFRSGSILLDTEGIGNQAYESYVADFVVQTNDDDDLGVVFCAQNHGTDAEPRYSYYRLAMRNNSDDETKRSVEKGFFFSLYGSVLENLTSSYLSEALGLIAGNYGANAARAKVLFITAGAIFPAVVTLTEAAGKSAFPRDRAPQFITLTKVDASGSSAAPLVQELQSSTVRIDLSREYDLKIELDRVSGEELKIYARVAPKESTEPLVEFTFTDPSPLGAGGIGLYSFSNNASIFSRASLTYFPAGKGTLGEVLFAPGDSGHGKPSYDCDAYHCRRVSAPETLAQKVRVNADDYRFVYVRGPGQPGNGSFTDGSDPVDLTPYGVDTPLNLLYSPFDTYVDRHVLGQLANDLSALLPHYYYFILPLCIGDSLHEAGDYDGAKKHYDVVFDLFPNEVTRITEHAGQSETHYADPERGGYPFLHVRTPLQSGVEEDLLMARHAANYLAAGEAAYARDGADNRQRAYEMFGRVLLSYGRTRCCSGWQGEVLCAPGQPPEAPADGDAGVTTSDGGERGGAISSAVEKKLERLLKGLRGEERERIEKQSERAYKQSRGNAKVFGRLVREVADRAEDALKEQQARVLGSAKGIAGLPATELDFPWIANAFELVGAQRLPYVALNVSAAGHRTFHPGHIRDTDHAGHAGHDDEHGATGPALCEPDEIGCLDAGDLAWIDAATGQYPCVPMNPRRRLHLDQACAYLDSLDKGLNVLGLREDQLSAYRYEYLIALARNFAQFAIGAEKDFIQFREKFASARLTLMHQGHALELLGAQMRVKELAQGQSELQVHMSEYQIDRSEAVDRHLDTLLELNNYQMALAVLGGAVGVSQGLFQFAGAGVGLVMAGGGLVVAGVGLAGAVFSGGSSLILTAAGGAASAAGGAAAAAATFGAGGMGAAGAGVTGLQNMLSVYQQRVQLRQNQELLRNYDIPLAHLNAENARLLALMAARQVEIGLMELRFAERILTYLSHQFLNADSYSFLARESKRNYRRYLAYGTRAAVMGEHALEVKRGQPFNIIKMNYFDVSVQGLMGGESLLKDIETLDYQRFVHDETRQYPPPKVFSLAASFPIEFEHFRRTGELVFMTRLEDFDLDFPGHYYRMIRSVRVNVIALVGAEGMKATLTRLGPSQVVVRRGNSFALEVLPGGLQTAVLANAPDGRGMIALNPEQEKLDPFEGSGVACTWLVEISRAANRFDFNTIADVQFLIDYSAFADPGYRQTVETELAASPRRSARVFRFRFDFPDAFYHLANASLSRPELTSSMATNLHTVTATTQASHYPHNERNRTPGQILLGFYRQDGKTLEVDEVRLASRRHIERLWKLDAGSPTAVKIVKLRDLPQTGLPGRVRVLRDGELLRVLPADVKADDVRLDNRVWHRVLRGQKLVWVPVGGEQAGDVFPVDPATMPLPKVIPVELIRACQVPGTKVVVSTASQDGAYFEWRVRDDGTPPAEGMKRVLLNHEVTWVETVPAGAVEISNGVWVRTLQGRKFAWAKEESLPADGVPYEIDDQWFVTLDPAANPALLGSKAIGGHPVLDMSSAAEVLMLIDYRFDRP